MEQLGRNHDYPPSRLCDFRHALTFSDPCFLLYARDKVFECQWLPKTSKKPMRAVLGLSSSITMASKVSFSQEWWLTPVNPNYSAGRDWEDQSFMPDQAKG
jgi:hypothetical protein